MNDIFAERTIKRFKLDESGTDTILRFNYIVTVGSETVKLQLHFFLGRDKTFKGELYVEDETTTITGWRQRAGPTIPDSSRTVCSRRVSSSI